VVNGASCATHWSFVMPSGWFTQALAHASATASASGAGAVVGGDVTVARGTLLVLVVAPIAAPGAAAAGGPVVAVTDGLA
jgi:hypothetical protein